MAPAKFGERDAKQVSTGLFDPMAFSWQSAALVSEVFCPNRQLYRVEELSVQAHLVWRLSLLALRHATDEFNILFESLQHNAILEQGRLL